MVTPCNSLILFLASRGGSALLGSSFCLGVPHQTRVPTYLPEVHALCDLGPDLSGSADAQRLRENDEDKDEGDFQLLLRTPSHSAAKIAVNWCPTVPEGVAYQLAD